MPSPEDDTVSAPPTTPSPPAVPRPGYSRPPTKNKKPGARARRTNREIVDFVERRQGKVGPELTMFVVKMYRAVDCTNRAQKELILKLGDEIRALKRKGGSK